MSARTRMSGGERRLSILNAAKPLFAKNGFKGTSIRQIAKAANVSEALLYRHFPSKAAMYKEILNYVSEISSITIRELVQLEAKTETLVLLTYLIVKMILFEIPGRGEKQKMHERLLFYSMLEDVSYAQVVFNKHFTNWYEIIYASYAAAVKAGDIEKAPTAPSNRFWFVHHLAMALNLCHVTGKSAFRYDMSKEELAQDAVTFSLRGMGLTDKAIKKYFKPEKLEAFVERLFR
jgi:AcrR family transcriptional regulator